MAAQLGVSRQPFTCLVRSICGPANFLYPVTAVAGWKRNSSNRASITKIRRNQYARMYPTLIVQPDGSTLRIRHNTPELIIKLPVDLASLSEEERTYRKLKQSPVRKERKREDIKVDFDESDYINMWKK